MKEYVEKGVEENVLEKYKEMKAKMEAGIEVKEVVGPLQQALTKRKGTITIIAEYKRKNSFGKEGRISDVFVPELVSATFREYGASAIAIMADERMGGCNYDDIKKFVEEQRRAQNEVPGPVPIINNDLIIDELQVAQTAAYGCAACVISVPIAGNDLKTLVQAANAIGVEPIVSVSSADEAQIAVDAGARIISVIHLDDDDSFSAAVDSIQLPEGATLCTIANVFSRSKNDVQEIQQAWSLRDRGFNCVWIGEALYKAGADAVETPGNIIKSMKSKSSVKWASPKVSTGKGEGAREYLGDLLM